MTQHSTQPDQVFVAHFLVGPTAVGKSAVAQCIAEQAGQEILSADSMLVYQGMDIGTAKPTRIERDRVRYHGIDLVTPAATFSVGDYLQHALRVLRPESDPPPTIVVGGTGLYVKALTEGLADLPGADAERRAYWSERAEAEGVEALCAELRRRAPRLCEALDDPGNARRVIRALELADAGIEMPPSDWRAGSDRTPLAGLRMSPEALSERIERRVRAMYAGGLVDEARGLREAWPELSSTATHAIGYAGVFAYLDGDCTRGEAIERTVVRTRRLAKRQRTWFRNQARVEWIDVYPGTPAEETAERVMEHWRRHGPTQIRF